MTKQEQKKIQALLLTKAKYKNIAITLGLTFSRVKNYARTVLEEAGVSSRTELLIETYSSNYRAPALKRQLRNSDHDIMLFLLKGYTARATSESLGITVTEVNVGRQRILEATGAKSAIDLVHKCYSIIKQAKGGAK